MNTPVTVAPNGQGNGNGQVKINILDFGEDVKVNPLPMVVVVRKESTVYEARGIKVSLK